MARTTKNNEVETIDLSQFNNSYEPDSIDNELKEKYGDSGGITNIYLYRTNEIGENFTLRKYPTLPEIDDIKNEFGGSGQRGFFRLMIKYKDSAGERKVKTYEFKIEGNPLIKQYELEKNAIQGPTDAETGLVGAITRLENKLVNILQNPQNNNDRSLVIEQMREEAKTTRELLLKMIETRNNAGGGDSNDKTILKILLDKALEKSTGELDLIDKVLTLTNKMGAKNSGEFDWNSILELVKTPAGQMFISKLIGGGARRVPGNIAGASNPGAAVQNPGGAEAALQQILTGVNEIRNDIALIKNDIKELQEVVFEDDPGTVHAGDNITEINTNGQQKAEGDQMNLTDLAAYTKDPEGFQRDQAAKIKAASMEEKLQVLNEYVNSIGAVNTFNWCFHYGALKSTDQQAALDEFNEYLEKAGFDILTMEHIK